MADSTTKVSEEYKREIDKLTSTTHTTTNNNNNNTIDQSTTSEKIDHDQRDAKESERQGKSEFIKDKMSRKISEIGEGTKSREEQGSSFTIKPIIFGLFALIGFIILVYSIFVAVVGEPLASIADTVFVVALIGSFTLVGVIVSHSFLKK
jgi:hypothetical protein